MQKIIRFAFLLFLVGANANGQPIFKVFVDSTSQLLFAANSEKLFIWFDNTLNVFNHDGKFESNHYLWCWGDALLVATPTHLLTNWHPYALDISTGIEFRPVAAGTPSKGFYYKDRY